jgi:hypothetical protein
MEEWIGLGYYLSHHLQRTCDESVWTTIHLFRISIPRSSAVGYVYGRSDTLLTIEHKRFAHASINNGREDLECPQLLWKETEL